MHGTKIKINKIGLFSGSGFIVRRNTYGRSLPL